MTVDPADGQRRAMPSLRHRDVSGVPIGRDPRPFVRHLDALRTLLGSIDAPAWCCGPTAAALHGMDGFTLAPPFHLVLHRGRRIHRFGHHLHVTRRLDPIDRASVFELPVTSPTRTLVDIAATETLDRLIAAIDSAVRDGGTSEDFLHRRLNALRERGRPGPRQLLRALEGHEVWRGGHSWLEREFLRLLQREGFPRPATQRVLGRRGDSLIRVDATFPGTCVVVELLGYRWHRTAMQMQVDAERLNQLQLRGRVVLQFTYADVVEASPTMFAALRHALSGAPPNAA